MNYSDAILARNSKGQLVDKPIYSENFNWFDYKEPFRKYLRIDGVWQNEFTSLLDASVEEVQIYSLEKEIDLGFLSHLPNLKAISLMCLKVKNFERLHELKNLESFFFSSSTNQNLNLNFADNLKVLNLEWKSKYQLDSLPRLLECIILSKGKKLNWDVLLSDKPNLLKVDLIDCDIHNGDILLQMPRLKYLALTGSKKVRFSGSSKNDSIGFVDFRGIPLTSLDWLLPLSSVEIVCLYNAGLLDSLEPTRDKSSIIGFMLSGNTTVQDGNLLALETLENLKNCFLVSKKNYTHKSLEPWNWNNFDQPKKKLLAVKQEKNSTANTV